jgi:hypothetical protein
MTFTKKLLMMVMMVMMMMRYTDVNGSRKEKNLNVVVVADLQNRS